LAVSYSICTGRSADALEKILGPEWHGVLVHDGYATYDRFEKCLHQQCLHHGLRRTHKVEEKVAGRAKDFSRRVRRLFARALARRDKLTAADEPAHSDKRRRAYVTFTRFLRKLTAHRRVNPENEKFAKHLRNHGEDWFTFLLDPAIPATNYLGEQGVRPGVVNRKVWGGNRDKSGSEAQAIHMSVIGTCRKQQIAPVPFISTTLCGHGQSLFAHNLAT
jgi:transposase